MDEKPNRERRSKKRFRVKEGALAFFGTVPGTIVDISETGIAINYAVFEQEPAGRFRLDIFFEDDAFNLPDIEAEVVTDSQTMAESGNDALQVRRLGLRFCELSDRQQDKLRYFILHNTTCAA
ncbi:MAG TPA: PilZ domain-containing protein [Desulfobulbus sp.]|nr:PilZ domain-containing protein [Desulfobulbus sp.]